LRSAATPEQRKQLDLEYVRKRSLVLDCAIVLNTVRQVVFKGGN
jgi:lipopolysaccharide/colanic/teichoic acid biosynthesis glycosyltransferase